MMDDEMNSMNDDQDDMMMMTVKKGLDFNGEIVIEVIEANNLTNKEVSDVIGDVSDPYCAIFLDKMEENRTKTVSNNLNPKWEEKFIIVVNGKYEDLQLQIFDYDPKKTLSDHLGLANIDLKSLKDEKKKDLWIPLQQNTTSTGNLQKDKVTGNLHIKIQYLAKGGEEKRKAEKEHENASKELETLKKQLEEAKNKLSTALEEDKVKLQHEMEEKSQLIQQAHVKEEELKKKAEEEKKKLIELFNKQNEEEKKKSAQILKEKEEAENRLKEALAMIDKIKKEIEQKNAKERELLTEIEQEKEKERRLRVQELQQSKQGTNVHNIPTVNFGGDFKPIEMSQPNKLFVQDCCNIAAAGSTIYALKTSGEILAITKKGLTSTVPGKLINIGVGSDGTFMGTDHALGIWKWGGTSWSKFGGLLTMLSVGDKDKIWGVGYGGSTWKYESEGQRWQQMPGKMRWVSVGGDGEVWAISVTGEAFRWETDSWRQTSLANATVITVSTKENIWAITEEGVLNQFRGSSWKAFPEWGKFRFVDIAEDSLFVIDEKGQVFSSALESTPLVSKIALPKNQVPGKLATLDIGGSILGGVDKEGRIWWKNFTDNNWVGIPGALANISVGQDDDIWGCTKDKQLYHWNKGNSQWVFSGNLVSVSVGNSSTIAGVGDGDSLWRCLSGRWEKLPGSGDQIAIGSDGEMWVKNSAGSVYRWVNNNWSYIPSPPVNFVTVGSAGNVVIQDKEDRMLYFFDGATWFPIKKSDACKIKVFSLNANGVTFSIDKHGEIFSSI